MTNFRVGANGQRSRSRTGAQFRPNLNRDGDCTDFCARGAQGLLGGRTASCLFVCVAHLISLSVR